MSNYEIRAKARQDLGSNIFHTNWMVALAVALLYMLISGACGSILPGIGAIIITGPLMFGVCGYFLSAARNDSNTKLENMFDGFQDFGGNFVLGLMIALFTALWTLLFIIPGIVKSYAYSMAFYIKRDHPEYDWKQCMDESQRIMSGNKAKLFLLDLSFLGWLIVGMLACGIGILWVEPYMQAARANFYTSLVDAPNAPQTEGEDKGTAETAEA